MENPKIIVIPPCNTFGDCLSVIPLVYFLREYYECVYFFIDSNNSNLWDYYDRFFLHDPKYGEKIFLTNNPSELINSERTFRFHICNTLTGDWESPKFDYYNFNNVEKDFYFNSENPLYSKIEIPKHFREERKFSLPNTEIETNHLFYFKMIGLNNRVRMEFFNYYRNKEREKEVMNEILSSRNLPLNSKYIIINDPIGLQDSIIVKNNFNLPIINISNLSGFPGELLLLIESAEEIHLVEGSNTNFLYHCQFKEIFKYKGKIFFHVWARNRNWPKYNLDFAWKMMDNPRLSNWIFLFEPPK